MVVILSGYRQSFYFFSPHELPLLGNLYSARHWYSICKIKVTFLAEGDQIS